MPGDRHYAAGLSESMRVNRRRSSGDVPQPAWLRGPLGESSVCVCRLVGATSGATCGEKPNAYFLTAYQVVADRSGTVRDREVGGSKSSCPDFYSRLSRVDCRLFSSTGKAFFGCVTSGESWQFLQLRENRALLDRNRLYLDNVPKILGVFQAICQSRC